MATAIVTTNGGANVGGFFSLISEPLGFILDNWYIFIIGILLCIAVGVVIYMIFATKDYSKQRDEAGYFLYKKTIEDCINNRDIHKYKKTYSWKNIFFLGIPLLPPRAGIIAIIFNSSSSLILFSNKPILESSNPNSYYQSW